MALEPAYNLTYWKGEKRKRKEESLRYLLSKKLLTASEILYMAIAKPLRYDSPLKIQHPGLGAPYFASEHLSVNCAEVFVAFFLMNPDSPAVWYILKFLSVIKSKM